MLTAMLWFLLLLSHALAGSSTVLITTGSSVCAGVAIGPSTVATAYHCVANGGRPRVELSDGSRAPGRVSAARVFDDLALIEVEGLELEARPMAEKSPQPGARVIVYGHPFGSRAPAGYLEGTLRFSRSEGIVSGLGPVALQTTAPVNPGNSGGPVFDEQGQIVGIVSRRLRGDGLGFATRVERLRALVEEPRGPSIVGGSFGAEVAVASWSGPAGTATAGVHLYMAARDRVVFSADLALPFTARWDSLRRGAVSWVDVAGHVALRQRLFRGAATAHVDARGGVMSVARLEGDAEALSFARSSAVYPCVGVELAFANVSLASSWAFTPDGPRALGQFRVAFPGRMGVF